MALKVFLLKLLDSIIASAELGLATAFLATPIEQAWKSKNKMKLWLYGSVAGFVIYVFLGKLL